ncbi:MAG: S8 family serine peptidase [Deltaproteobacteria bacterium]|nr:S8 family serine peptidase [Deltaproteobacteria bacterium]
MAGMFFMAAGVRYVVSLLPVAKALELRRSAARAVSRAATRAMPHSAAKRAAPAPAKRQAAQPEFDLAKLQGTIRGSKLLASRVSDPGKLAVAESVPAAARPARAGATPPEAPRTTIHAIALATETVIAEGAHRADLTAARNQLGARVIDESLDGKALLRVDSVEKAFRLVALLLSRQVAAAPNFLRRMARRPQGAGGEGWALDKIGVPAAWKITRGIPDIRIAILDEGVDGKHRALRQALVAERDFIGTNGASAAPAGDDAHGTACAGIAVSREEDFPGVAPGCSLIAARIGMGDGSGGWVLDDYQTADAIDWCWRQGADVLSNSWALGAPSDPVARAFGRARTQGRNGKGAVVAIAAGNQGQAISFPGNLPGFFTVGASNQADQRKTTTSSDGERNWGSNAGPTLLVLAPGVSICTTDIGGAAGYDPGDFTRTFNGTSAATPHVAGAAALMLSVNPALGAHEVRSLLGETAKALAGQKGWTAELGHGRLDVARAVAAARAHGAVAGARKGGGGPA